VTTLDEAVADDLGDRDRLHRRLSRSGAGMGRRRSTRPQ
jgi:hypothetical protein